jgi:hypothetical protein
MGMSLVWKVQKCPAAFIGNGRGNVSGGKHFHEAVGTEAAESGRGGQGSDAYYKGHGDTDQGRNAADV